MSFKDYFQKEMIELRKLAREQMLRNPALEPFLNTPGKDSDIERILESFAFITARLRQKLGDNLPEITHNLFGMLWPNYLRPIPSASVIQYQASNISDSVTVPKGTLVETPPVDGTDCRFQTVYDTEILPLQITDQYFFERYGETILAVRFKTTSGSLNSFPLSKLRIFFTGEKNVAQTLHFTLLHRLKEVRITLRDENHENRTTAVLTPASIKPLGFLEDEGLYPYPDTLRLGYRVLQEYFSFPEKFMFVEISGLNQGINNGVLQRFNDADAFELHFVLKERPEFHESFQVKNWQLFCTPVVNIFPFTPVPQKIEKSTLGHKVVPDPKQPELLVYSVERVSNWAGEGKKGEEYHNINSFAYLGSKNSSASYYLNMVPTLDNSAIEVYIVVGETTPDNAILELDLLCTNGNLPLQLGIGDICIEAENAHSVAVPFKNITPVTVPYPPPCQGDTLWRLFSNMSLNYIAITDVPALREIIGTAAFRAAHEHEQARQLAKILQAIVAVESPSIDWIVRGVPMRGARTCITMDQSAFDCEGAMFLFGSVLNEFLGMYATPNSFHQLVIKEVSRGEEYRWPVKLGSVLRS